MKCFAVCVICVAQIVGRHAGGVSESTCKRPPVPEGGHYSPVKDSYSRREAVKYSCDDEYLISDENDLLCDGNNQWKGIFPTCDKATVPADGFLHFKKTIDRNAIDSNDETCLKVLAPAGRYVIPLKDSEQIVVTAVKITIKSKAESIKVSLVDNYGERRCDRTQIISARQLKFMCNTTYYTKEIIIENISTVSLQDELCEVKIFRYTENIPTMGIDAYVVTGQEVNTNAIDRNPSTCVEGFSPGTIYQVHLNQSEKVHAVRLTAKSDISMNIFVDEGEQWKKCETQLSENTGNQSVVFCPVSGEHKSKYVAVRNTDTSSMDLCEVEIFLKSDGLQCSLERFGIEHGQVFYNESHAWLSCDQNYKAVENVIKCEGRDQWSDINRFQCEEISCDFPSDPPLGHWINSSTNESSAKKSLSMGMNLKLKCNYGYTPNGTNITVTCLHNGLWSVLDVACVEISTVTLSQFNETSDLQSPWLIYGVSGAAGFLILLILLLIIYLYFRDKRKKMFHIMKDNELYEQNLTSSADDVNYDYAMINESAHFSSVNESVTISLSENNITTLNPKENEYREADGNDGNVNIAANDSQSVQERNVILSEDWVESGYEYVSFEI